MKKAALYIRVSTQEQAKEGYSIPGQKDKLIAYCKAKNWLIYDIYVDGGFSGANLERPSLKQLLNDLEHIDIVLVYKLDRLSRSQKDTLHLIEDEFLSKDVGFASLSEAFDTTTPFGKAMIGILSVFAQLERETIKERAKLGKERRAKEGLWRGGGNVPTGYSYYEDHDELVIDDYEAMQVREIFKLYREGKGYQRIAELLNSRGYRKNNGTKWQINAVKRILKNPVYKGYIMYKGDVYTGNHEAIISEEYFDEVQELLAKRGTRPYPKSKYLLSGMVWCGYCSARMKATWITRYKNGPKHNYYICYSLAGSPSYMVKDSNCPGKHIPMKQIDDFVIEALNKLKLDKKEIISLHNKEQKQTPPPLNIGLLKDKIKSIEKQITKLIDLYQYDHIPPKELSQRTESLYKDKQNLQETIEQNTQPKVDHPNIELHEILSYLDKPKLIWQEATFEEKRMILKNFIKKIHVKNDGISIEWRLQ